MSQARREKTAEFQGYLKSANDFLADQRTVVKQGSGLLKHHYLVMAPDEQDKAMLVAQKLHELRVFVMQPSSTPFAIVGGFLERLFRLHHVHARESQVPSGR